MQPKERYNALKKKENILLCKKETAYIEIADHSRCPNTRCHLYRYSSREKTRFRSVEG